MKSLQEISSLLKDNSDINFILSELKERDKEILKWKENHDNQVKLKSILIDRPDLRDRATRISKLIEENKDLKEKINHLLSGLYF